MKGQPKPGAIHSMAEFRRVYSCLGSGRQLSYGGRTYDWCGIHYGYIMEAEGTCYKGRLNEKRLRRLPAPQSRPSLRERVSGAFRSLIRPGASSPAPRAGSPKRTGALAMPAAGPRR